MMPVVKIRLEKRVGGRDKEKKWVSNEFTQCVCLFVILSYFWILARTTNTCILVIKWSHCRSGFSPKYAGHYLHYILILSPFHLPQSSSVLWALHHRFDISVVTYVNQAVLRHMDHYWSAPLCPLKTSLMDEIRSFPDNVPLCVG